MVCDIGSCVLREFRLMAACMLSCGLPVESKQTNECKLWGNFWGESRNLLKQEAY